MNINFKNLTFSIANNKVCLSKLGSFCNLSDSGFLEIQIAGENKASHEGIKMTNSSEGKRLSYVSHSQRGNMLTITQQSDLVKATTFFETYSDTNAVRIHTEVTNISESDIIIEDISAAVIGGLSPQGISDAENVYITEFVQSHHAECQPRRHSFKDLGFVSDSGQRPSQKRISFANVGSWSTKERLPQAIIENQNGFMMFQIESSSSWYYEISDRGEDIYLYMGGANTTFGSWCKKLKVGESYVTPNVAIAEGESLNDVIAHMTHYRRHISGLSPADRGLPSIYNEYMHLSWDSPSEDITAKVAPAVADMGVEYYVIDCGWHDEEPGNVIYHYVGQWKESKTRFPNGLRATTDYIRSLGMKAGLWIEPEIVGVKCEKMLSFYDDDCFFQRYGKRVSVHDRYFLDYRNPKVTSYMTETIRRMVEDYGADYIKFDYNQDSGVGTDLNCSSPGEGLELCNRAFFGWVENMKNRFPDVIFEGCASGGMRMDYKSLSVFSLMSTSDQTDYLKYPCIAANILSAVLPEQAAVWSYPVAWLKEENISENCTAMNMINSFLGRIHLASHIDWMNEANKKLVADGVKYYKKLSAIKGKAVPYLPMGFSLFGQKIAASGIRHENKVYLAVWNLADETKTKIELDEEIASAEIVYPNPAKAKVKFESKELFVNFESEKSAVFIEITF